MSNQNRKKWIVKGANGKISGPYSTEQILERIDENRILGSEFVASYPGGSWIPISKSPEFYDRLLDVLQAEVKSAASGRNQGGAAFKDQITSEQPPNKSPLDSVVTNLPPTQSVGMTKPTSIPQITHATALQAKSEDDTSEDGDIELEDLRAIDRLQKLKATKVPLQVIVAGLILAIAAIWFSSDDSVSGTRIRLITPRDGQTELGDAKIKEKLKRALAAFQTDTFSGYQRAQNELVEIVEGASGRPENAIKKADYLSFLCLTYRELWPFAYQDPKDLKAVSTVMQEAKKLDPAGLHGSLCEIVNLTVNGKRRDAHGLTESVILEKSQTPVLFEMRGEAFMSTFEFDNAANYFAQAKKLWPAWQKSRIQEARAFTGAKKYSQAIQLYREVLEKVPDHPVAKVEWGLLEALQFDQLDKGYELIASAVDETIPREIAAKGYLGIAQIFIKKKQNGRALEAAQKSYAFNPVSKEAKDLVDSLGGKGEGNRVKASEADLMFMGEQYMRSGDFYSAQAQFKAAYDSNSRNGIAAMKAGKCLWELNQTADAIDWMKKAIKADPQLISAYVELADYFARRFDFFTASEWLKKAQALQPNNFEVYRGFATVELRRNNYQGALGHAQRALKFYESDLETLLIIARAHLGLHQYNEAQKFAARAIELDYNNTTAQSLYARIEAGLYGIDAGASYIQQLLNRYIITKGQQVPQAAIDYRVTLGEMFLQEERHKQAEDLFRQAISLDPNNKSALIGIGKALQAQSLIAQALEFYLKAAVIDPADADPIYFSGQLYSDIGRPKEATLQFERVLKINPRYPKAHAALGRVALRAGDPKKAIEEAMQERAINPDLSDSFVLGAEAYFMMKQYSNCAGEYQKAVAKKGPNATILVRMARCYRLAGAIDSAQSLLRQATQLESGNPDIYKEQGAIFHIKGMADEALTAYDKYLMLAPNAPDRADVEARIRKVQSGDMQIGD